VPNEMSTPRAFASVQIPSILRKVSYNDSNRSLQFSKNSEFSFANIRVFL
jgi:hypothetical protein